MRQLLALPIAVPIFAAAAGLVAGNRPRARRLLGMSAYVVVLAVGAALVAATADGRTLVLQVGGWPPGIAIVLVGDLFSALMLTVAALMTVACTSFAAASGTDRDRLFHPLVGVLLCGVSGSFLTGDVFNLFVFFEVMLIASYVLLTLGGGRRQVRGGAVYVTTNLLASTLFVASVALLYGATGTVNMAALATSPAAPAIGVGTGMLFVVFAVKAALFPVHGWLPTSYPVAHPAVTALFSGLLTKVALYAMYRVYSVVLAGDPSFRRIILVASVVTMVGGVLGAVGQDAIREILSFHMVSQMGYVLLGLAVFSPFGLAAGIFFMLQYIAVKTSLFLSAGAVEAVRGTGRLAKLGGLAVGHPVLASGFIVSALALSGIPPLSGFFGKYVLVRAAFDQGEYLGGAAAVAVSFFTLLSMVKIWTGAFSGGPAAHESAIENGSHSTLATRKRITLFAPAVVLAAITIVLGLWANGLFTLAEQAAAGLADPTAYVRAVLER